MPTVSVRLPEGDAESLDDVAELLGEDRSSVMRRALRRGLDDLRRRHAVAAYGSGEASALGAARMAGLSVAEWLDAARAHNLTTQLSPEDLRDDAEAARRP